MNHFRRSLILAATAFLLFAPATARAGDEARTTPVWLVFMTEPTRPADRNWGVLSLADGRLTFDSNSGNKHWHADLADSWRIAPSKQVAGAFDLELRGGQVFVVTVLNAQLMPQSPKSAIRTIVDAANAIKNDGRRLAEASAVATKPAEPAAAAATARIAPGGGGTR